MQVTNVHPALTCDAPARCTPKRRLPTGLRNHAFWIVSLMIHAVVLSMATPRQRLAPQDTDQIIITARLTPPGRAPTMDLPPLPPPPRTPPAAHRPFAASHTVARAPRISFPLPRFIAARASAPLWGFWFPSCASVVESGPPGPPSPTAVGAGSSNEIGGSFTAPSYQQTPLPAYPPMAKARHWEGVALLHVEVMTDGSVNRVELLHSSGHRELDESALKAVRAWRFEPAKRGDVAVACFIQVPIRFKLDL